MTGQRVGGRTVADYLLDANHLSPLVTPGHELRGRMLKRLQFGDRFAIPLPALTEFLYGIQVLPRVKANLAEWNRLQDSFIYYKLDRADAHEAARLQVALRRRGRQLATVDALIATVALRYGLTLLTTDRDFEPIQQLRQENWLSL